MRSGAGASGSFRRAAARGRERERPRSMGCDAATSVATRITRRSGRFFRKSMRLSGCGWPNSPLTTKSTAAGSEKNWVCVTAFPVRLPPGPKQPMCAAEMPVMERSTRQPPSEGTTRSFAVPKNWSMPASRSLRRVSSRRMVVRYQCRVGVSGRARRRLDRGNQFAVGVHRMQSGKVARCVVGHPHECRSRQTPLRS